MTDGNTVGFTFLKKHGIMLRMYGIYGDIISAAQRALEGFDETKELLEYPEVQADKAYYLSVLSKYNRLSFIKDRLDALTGALEEERAVYALLAGASGEERTAVLEEISALKRKAAACANEVADALGCRHVSESAYCRLKFSAPSAGFGTELYRLLKSYLNSRGARVYGEKADGCEISFTAEGADVLTCLIPLCGAHRVIFSGSKSGQLCFAATTSATELTLSEKDLKTDVFHSHGAGGQNINKVETAVRITHIPTGVSVVCQDERSQLKNRKRALETLEKRLNDISGKNEKNRIEADIYACYMKKNTAISFDAGRCTMTDTRLEYFDGIPFPPTEAQFASYMDGLTAL